MDSRELGKVIKTKRQSLRLTQADVVGEFITRNMLSQIESGIANPSLKTLRFLSDRLDIPFSMLLGGPDYSPYLKAKECYNTADFGAVLAIVETAKESEFSDELYVAAALSAIELAEKSYMTQDIESCRKFCEKAKLYSQMGIFVRKDLNESADKLLLLCKKDESAVKTA
ncbi:MAG: helix-turn-helix domain-containing protein [Ruminococcus sp.]|nr:helix-turn-helix domain-containing protein [Ruminococcus sp.]